MDTKKFTLNDWREFMNGYRDPISREADRQALRAAGLSGGGGKSDFLPGGQGGGAEGERECGHRKDGGTYAVVPSSPNGRPVDEFLLCAPVAVDKDEYNLSNVGVRLVDLDQVCLACSDGKDAKTGFACSVCSGTQKETVTHVFDIVGQEYYPNIADFIEEARRMGISRRLELEDTNQYARLSTRSRLFLLHHKAVIKNPMDIFYAMQTTELLRLDRAGCPKALAEHKTQAHKDGLIAPPAKHGVGCSALYWNVIEGGERVPEMREDLVFMDAKETSATDALKRYEASVKAGFVKRELASGTYYGYRLREDVKPKYSLGIFASFPLARIEVVNESGEYEDRVERASAARLDVIETEC